MWKIYEHEEGECCTCKWNNIRYESHLHTYDFACNKSVFKESAELKVHLMVVTGTKKKKLFYYHAGEDNTLDTQSHE